MTSEEHTPFVDSVHRPRIASSNAAIAYRGSCLRVVIAPRHSISHISPVSGKGIISVRAY